MASAATVSVPFDLIAEGTSAATVLSTVGVVVVPADVDVVVAALLLLPPHPDARRPTRSSVTRPAERQIFLGMLVLSF